MVVATKFRDSEIFEAHPDTLKVMAEERKYKRLIWACWAGVFLGLLLFCVFLILSLSMRFGPSYPTLVSGLGYTGLFLTVFSIGGAGHLRDKKNELFHDIWQDARKLEDAIGLPREEFLASSTEHIKTIGEARMLVLVAAIITFEREVAAVKIENASRFILAAIKVGFEQEKLRLKQELTQLHFSLFTFGLTEPTYDWVFDKVEKISS